MRKDALEPPKLRILTYAKGILHQRHFDILNDLHRPLLMVVPRARA